MGEEFVPKHVLFAFVTLLRKDMHACECKWYEVKLTRLQHLYTEDRKKSNTAASTEHRV